MDIIRTPDEMQRWSDSARASGERIALVPTMGFLHEGHLTLMREGRRSADMLVASIFVNPTQFGPNEDFARYPRSFERDCAMMETVPVDAVFAPEPASMYAAETQTWVEATEVTKRLCGPHRPGHFRGVTTVVAKLFNIVKPHLAVFGEGFSAATRDSADGHRLNFDIESSSADCARARRTRHEPRNAYRPRNANALMLSGPARRLITSGHVRAARMNWCMW